MNKKDLCIWGWIGAGFVVLTLCVLGYVHSLNGDAAWSVAKSVDTPKAYREFYAAHRTDQFAVVALSQWEASLQQMRDKLDLLDASAVSKFLRDFPEVDAEEIRRAQYEAVMTDKTYHSLYGFYTESGVTGKHRDAIGKVIDEMVSRDIEEAEKARDVAQLRKLSSQYAKWKGSAEIANKKAAAIVAERNLQKARSEWDALRDSRSETDLLAFAKKYSGTRYSELARIRVECLYDDYAFVKGKGTVSAYRKYLERNPNGTFAADANRCLGDVSKQCIDLEVENVARSHHGSSLEPHRSYESQIRHGKVAKISFENSTDYAIVILYSGEVQSYRKSIEPYGSATLSLSPGVYKVAVKAKDSNVSPFYAEILLSAGVYTEEFRIPPTRNGNQIYRFPKMIPKSKYPSRRSSGY